MNDESNVYIGRPNKNVKVEECKWTCPFREEDYGAELAHELYREWVITGVNPVTGEKRKEGPLLNNIEELRGKFLGGWSKPEPCHGDVLVSLLKKDKASKKENKSAKMFYLEKAAEHQLSFAELQM